MKYTNIGNPPRAQIILCGAYRGWKVKRWTGALSEFFRFSVLLGPVEFRVWRRQVLVED
jgi:hypothetical protein